MPSTDTEALLLMQQATAAHGGGDTARALQLLDDAVAVVPDDAPKLRAGALIQKAGWMRETGATSDALKLLDDIVRDLDLLPREGHEEEWALVRMEQGLHARDRGDLPSAERLLQEGEALAEKSRARDILLTDLYANRAGVYMDQARFSEAQDLLFAALEIDTRVGNNRSASNDLNMLGLVYRALGDDETGRTYLTRAFELAFENELMREATQAMSNLAALMDDLGDHAGAAEIFEHVGMVASAGGDDASLACSVANQGCTAARAGNLEQARSLFERSHALHLEAGNPTHAVQDQLNLSSVEGQLGHAEKAFAHAERALKATNEFGLISILWAAEYRVASCRQVLAHASHDESETMRGYEAALDGYRRAADTLELLRSNVDRPEERESLLSGKEVVYDNAIMLSLALHRVHDAFELSERARMRSFLEALGPRRLERLEEADPAASQRRELTDRLLDPRTAPSEKPTLMEELRLLRAQMIARRPAVATITEATLPRQEDVRAAIPTDAHVLEFFQVGNSVIHFLLGPEGLEDCGVARFDEPLEEIVQGFRDQIEAGDRELAAGNTLFAALIRPVMPQLARAMRLIIVPHGVLHRVPFSALWFVPAGVDAPPRQYLKNRFYLTTIPSASYLHYLARAKADEPRRTAAVVLGNPTGDLAGAEIEAHRVAAKLDVAAEIGARATRSAVLTAGSPIVLHVASHGSYNAADPLLSGLRLADGLLTVEELLDAGPAPRLLVLSGCVTGLSERRPGDELIGLAHAALQRGTRSVVATLWETFDESSAVFFEHFYDAMVRGSGVSEALAWARDALSTGPGAFDQPVDWAPFLLIGDPDTRIADPPERQMADYDRGAVLAEQGDLRAAKAAFERAIEHGAAEEAAWAAFALGTVLAEEGDREGAVVAFRRALASDDPAVAPMAMSAVARLIEVHDSEGAKALYRQAIASRHPEASPNAALDLGSLLVEEGDTTGAQAAYEHAMYSTHTSAGPKAAYNLGVLLATRGDLVGARAAFQRAIDSGDDEVAQPAAANLRALPALYP